MYTDNTKPMPPKKTQKPTKKAKRKHESDDTNVTKRHKMQPVEIPLQTVAARIITAMKTFKVPHKDERTRRGAQARRSRSVLDRTSVATFDAVWPFVSTIMKRDQLTALINDQFGWYSWYDWWKDFGDTATRKMLEDSLAHMFYQNEIVFEREFGLGTEYQPSRKNPKTVFIYPK